MKKDNHKWKNEEMKKGMSEGIKEWRIGRRKEWMSEERTGWKEMKEWKIRMNE